jgi:hypothetical protein
LIGGLHHSSIALSFGCPDCPTFSTTTTYSFPSNGSDGILFFAIGGTPEVWCFVYNVINNNITKNSKSGPCCAAVPITYSSNRENIVSTSQIMVKQQGLKPKTNEHGADHENVKLWCIGMQVVGIR